MNAFALSKQSKEMQGSAWCIKQHKVFRVFIHTGIPNRIPLNFEKGQGLARGKRKGKGNARILASKEKKKFNCKIRGVTNSRLRSRGPDTHYWSGVRRPAPRRAPWPPQATRAPRPLLIRGSKAGPRRVHSRLRHRARDDQGYVRYITKARAALPRYPRTFPRPAGTIL